MSTESKNYLKIFFDGGSRGNPGPSAAAFVVFDDKGKKIIESSKSLGKTTNNIAEYNGLLLSLEGIENLDVKNIIINTDSKLVFSQVKGLWKVKNDKILSILVKIRDKLQKYETVDLRLIPREKNKIADRLVNQELDNLNLVNDSINFDHIED